MWSTVNIVKALAQERAKLRRIQVAALKREQKIALRQAMRVESENLVNKHHSH